MPSMFGHAMVPLALRLGLGQRQVPGPMLAAGLVLAVLPDADVLSFRLGIPYASPYGHRGFTHSLLFSAVMALLALLPIRTQRRRPMSAFLFLFLAGASHGLLDCLTDGGLGVALWWPFSDARLFAPVRPIRVSKLSLHRFFSDSGWSVLRSELLWTALPALTLGVILRFLRTRRRHHWI